MPTAGPERAVCIHYVKRSPQRFTSTTNVALVNCPSCLVVLATRPQLRNAAIAWREPTLPGVS